MDSIFSVSTFDFPYKDLKFPGQHSEEKILFVTREGILILGLRWLVITFITLALLIAAAFINHSLSGIIPDYPATVTIITLLTIATINPLALWWTYTMWRKSVFIVTTRRLTKFIHNTPWSRYQLSLALDKIADTGAYQKGWFQIFSGYGYFVARSAAGNIKNFKIINISFAEDLHNYVNKLLFTFQNTPTQIDNFRPFIPHLKGEARKAYVKKIAPEYYLEKNNNPNTSTQTSTHIDKQ